MSDGLIPNAISESLLSVSSPLSLYSKGFDSLGSRFINPYIVPSAVIVETLVFVFIIGSYYYESLVRVCVWWCIL